MQFHYDKALEKCVGPITETIPETPACLTIDLVCSLKEWFGQPYRISCRDGENLLLIGYEVCAVPTLELAQNFGSLICKIDPIWPVQVFGIASNNELVELSFVEANSTLTMRQRNISGIWCEALQDLHLCIQFPDSTSANCMSQLLCTAAQHIPAAALGWDYADFLEQQRLAVIDRTLTFCYVVLDPDSIEEISATCLAGLQLNQKKELWRLFLEKRFEPPEFEWLRDALLRNCVPDWIEWQLALYHTLEQLDIQFVCNGKQFELIDKNSNRLYFSVDHISAAEHILMKILYPLNE